MNTIKDHSSKHSFANGGELGNLILQHDWSSSSIGPLEGWPQSLRTTLDIILNSAFPMFLFWGKDLICFYNDAYRPSLGASGKHPAIGRKAQEVWPEIWTAIHPLIEQVMTTGKPAWFEDRLIPILRNNTLEDVYWTFSYSPAFTDEGNIGGVLVTCMETTPAVLSRLNTEGTVRQRTEDLRTAHEALGELNAFFQSIIDISKEPLQVLKPVFEGEEIIDFSYRFSNTAYAGYARTTPDKLQDKKVSDFFPGYFKTTSFVNVVEAFNTGNSHTWEIHYDVDGLDLYNRMSAVKMGDYVVVLFTDFTELKYLQLELLKKISELEQSNRNLEDFAHAVSHDLKEPVRKIKMFLEKLKSELEVTLSEPAERSLAKIESATERMGKLIEDLLTFSSVSQLPAVSESVDLSKYILLVLEDLELDIHDKNAEVILQDLPIVNGQPRQLQQMFQNLIANALKYSRAGVKPVITIKGCEKEIDGATFHVLDIIDNGIGFEPRFSDKIFQAFTRLHGRSEYSGSGIGLSIVKKVVDNHNGKIKTESLPGKGSTFSIYLPK